MSVLLGTPRHMIGGETPCPPADKASGLYKRHNSEQTCSLRALSSLRREMHDDAFAFQDWTRERDAVEREMNLLLGSPRATLEDRRVRQIQFAALIERRNAAMQNLLQSASPIHRSMIRDQTATKESADPQTAEEVAALIKVFSEEILNFDLGPDIQPQTPVARVEMVANVLEYRAQPEAPLLANASRDERMGLGDDPEFVAHSRVARGGARFLPLWRSQVRPTSQVSR